MWTREELKIGGKQAFYKNYWMSVAVGLLLLLISSEDFWEIRKVLDSQDDSVISSGWGIFTVIGIFLVLFYLLFTLLIIFAKIFIGNVFAIGGYRFFILNRTENPSGKNLLYGFKSGHYGNIVLTMFLKNLYISLWTLLLVIPGIIKRYEYCMIPYILAENPGMDRRDAFQISRRMMMGQKWEVFVLDLSFIGWHILTVLSFGLVGIFFAGPYYQATFAELYIVNKRRAYEEGYIR